MMLTGVSPTSVNWPVPAGRTTFSLNAAGAAIVAPTRTFQPVRIAAPAGTAYAGPPVGSNVWTWVVGPPPGPSAVGEALPIVTAPAGAATASTRATAVSRAIDWRRMRGS